ncbi:MAG: rRNA ((1402)-2-O)-methyltransferase [Pseudomonadota bacterium]
MTIPPHTTPPPGKLYVVSTPIGHLDDLSMRAAQTLRSVDFVAAEDTRVTRTLLTRIGSSAKLLAAHQHNEDQAAERIIALLRSGASVALVSDAGTPAISDPGTRIVSATLDAGLCVTPIPGPSAVTAMLSACGLAPGGFLFEGFLPQRPGPRQRRLETLARLDQTVVLFEAPHRIAATCEAIVTVFGAQRMIALGRELTKQFEEIARMPAGESADWLAAHAGRAKGEYVVVIARSSSEGSGPGTDIEDSADAPDDPPLTVEIDVLLNELLPELGARRASRLIERIGKRPGGSLYRRAVQRQALDRPSGGEDEAISEA